MEGKGKCSRAADGCARLLLLVTCMAVAAGIAAAATGGEPAAAPDCSAAIGNLVDCLNFVQNGSTAAKPQGNCCSGLKKVVKTEVSCLCEAFKSSANFGVVLNMTKALSLPAACGVSTPSISKCKISGFATAPAPAPHFFTPLGPAVSPSARGGAVGVPAPTPMKAAAPVVSMPSIAFLLAGVAVAAYLCF